MINFSKTYVIIQYYLANIFVKVIPTYEKLMLTEYTNGK